jgi:hypothetical protein
VTETVTGTVAGTVTGMIRITPGALTHIILLLSCSFLCCWHYHWGQLFFVSSVSSVSSVSCFSQFHLGLLLEKGELGVIDPDAPAAVKW